MKRTLVLSRTVYNSRDTTIAGDGNKFCVKTRHHSSFDKSYKDTIGRFSNNADLVSGRVMTPSRVYLRPRPRSSNNDADAPA